MSGPALTSSARSCLLIVGLLVLHLAGCASPPDTRPLAQRLPAEFTGTLPCADCPGIDYRLQLRDDGVFLLRRTYQGGDERDSGPGEGDRSFDDIGRWLLSSDQSILLLDGGDAPQRFAVESAEVLRYLDRSGETIESTSDYRLRRESRLSPLQPVLTLRGMYHLEADDSTPRFTECQTGLQLPVGGGDAATAVRQVYLQERVEAASPLLMSVEARLASAEPNSVDDGVDRGADDGTSAESLEITRFLRAWPDLKCPEKIANADLTGTFWRLVRLAGQAIAEPTDQRAPFIRREEPGRIAGSTGCNRIAGNYVTDGAAISFSQLASTRKSCRGGAVLELMFVDALTGAARWNILGRHLELYDAEGTRLVRFEASGELLR